MPENQAGGSSSDARLFSGPLCPTLLLDSDRQTDQGQTQRSPAGLCLVPWEAAAPDLTEFTTSGRGDVTSVHSDWPQLPCRGALRKRVHSGFVGFVGACWVGQGQATRAPSVAFGTWSETLWWNRANCDHLGVGEPGLRCASSQWYP